MSFDDASWSMRSVGRTKIKLLISTGVVGPECSVERSHAVSAQKMAQSKNGYFRPLGCNLISLITAQNMFDRLHRAWQSPPYRHSPTRSLPTPPNCANCYGRKPPHFGRRRFAGRAPKVDMATWQNFCPTADSPLTTDCGLGLRLLFSLSILVRREAM